MQGYTPPSPKFVGLFLFTHNFFGGFVKNGRFLYHFRQQSIRLVLKSVVYLATKYIK